MSFLVRALIALSGTFRALLQTAALKAPLRAPPPNLYERIRARFAPLGGADDLAVPPRMPDRDPPRFN
jgi:hypothetical protein